MLESDCLLLQHLNLPVSSVKFNLSRLLAQDNIFQLRPRLEQLPLCLVVLSLFFLVPFNPHVPCLFLLAYRLIQVGDLIGLLLLKQFELPLN
jgi:hypothetical protein